MKRQSKLNSQEQAQQHQAEQQTQQSSPPRSSPHAEEMLRHDALHTPVPPAIGQPAEGIAGPIAAARPPPLVAALFGQ